MSLSSTLLILLTNAIPPLEMQTILAHRLAALDRIEGDVTWEVHSIPAGLDPFDRTNWSAAPPTEMVQFRIVRPDALLEVPENRSSEGAIQYSIRDGATVMKYCRPDPETGRLYFHTAAGSEGMFLESAPVLQALELHVMGAPDPRMTLGDLLATSNVSVASSGADSLYSIGFPTAGGSWTCEFTLSGQGVPVRIATEKIMDGFGHPYRREQRTLATTVFDGVTVPTEIAVATWNRNVLEPGCMCCVSKTFVAVTA